MGVVPGRGIASLSLDDASVPREHQFEMFRNATAPVFEVRRITPTADSPTYASDYFVDGLIVSRLRYEGLVMRRTRRHLGVADDSVSVLLHARGGMHGVIGDLTDLSLDSDHVAIFDFANSFACCAGATDVIWIMIPRDRLTTGGLPCGTPLVRFHRSSPRGRVLAASIEQLWADVVSSSADRSPELAAAIVEAVDATLRPGDFAPDDASLRTAMQRHIDANLDQPGLGHEMLCSTFFCSRSAVYRLFKSEGGVAAYIRKQRLLQCFEELTATTAATRSVTSIATAWGFDNPSHFNRLFKSMFGIPPSWVVERSCGSTPESEAQDARPPEPMFPTWVAAL